MKEEMIVLPRNCTFISEKEQIVIEGGIGPTTIGDGKYTVHENVSSATETVVNFFRRYLDLDYGDQKKVDQGFALIGIFQTIINAVNPAAIAKAINVAPVITGVLESLGNIGMSRV